jgi:hypothetical protein
LFIPELQLAIISYLPSVVDVYNFCSINKAICCCGPAEKKRRQAVLRETFLSNLAQMLAPFDLSVAEFLQALRDDDAALAGGAALAVVTAKFAKGSDLDVFFARKFALQEPNDVTVKTAALLRGSGYWLNYTSDRGGPENNYNYGLTVFTAKRCSSHVQLVVIPAIAEGGEATYNHERLLTGAPYLPPHLRTFDHTVCCVSLSVSPTSGELHWNIPYLADIAAGVTGPTQYLRHALSERNIWQRESTLKRMAKYLLRGYKSTEELMQLTYSGEGSYYSSEDEDFCGYGARRRERRHQRRVSRQWDGDDDDDDDNVDDGDDDDNVDDDDDGDDDEDVPAIADADAAVTTQTTTRNTQAATRRFWRPQRRAAPAGRPAVPQRSSTCLSTAKSSTRRTTRRYVCSLLPYRATTTPYRCHLLTRYFPTPALLPMRRRRRTARRRSTGWTCRR